MERTAGSFGSSVFTAILRSTRGHALSRQPSLILFSLDVMPASAQQLTQWAESCLHANHLNTLVQREPAAGNLDRARELSERARNRAWTVFNEVGAAGGKKPEGYAEPSKDL